jgi:hypothetical protein
MLSKAICMSELIFGHQITILLWCRVISQKNGILRTSKLRSNAVAILRKPTLHFSILLSPSTPWSRGILDLGIRWRWMVNFKHRLLYRPESSPVSTGQKDVSTPEPVWMVLEKRKSLALAGIRTPDRPARSESLYRLRVPGSHFPFQTRLK